MARQVAEIFTEVIVAPSYADGAVEHPDRQEEPPGAASRPSGSRPRSSYRQVSGGLLVQTADRIDAPGDDPAPVAPGRRRARPPTDVLADLVFAWRAVRSVKSNAILLARDGATVGVGMGQVNRVDSARLAVSRAGDRAGRSVAASDAFFPFPDGLRGAHRRRRDRGRAAGRLGARR